MSGLLEDLARVGTPPDQELPSTIVSSDPRYTELSRSDNQRFPVEPDQFVLATDPQHVVSALGDCVAAGHEVACRSGGHCGADFVGTPRRRTVIDLCQMNRVTARTGQPGVRIEAGATVGHVQKELFRRFGAALPLGACSAVGVGGLVAGGGYGALSRQLGLVADHLDAVEVAVVDDSRRVRLVTARASDTGELGDLFWAHTGGGGGNFGIVTAYEFQSPPHLVGTEIGLPRAASALNVQKVMYPWALLDQDTFTLIVERFLRWHADHSDPDSPECSVFGSLFLHHNSVPFVQFMAQSDADVDVDGSLLGRLVGSLTEGTPMPPIARGGQMSWLTGTRYMSQADCGDVMGARSASKSGYHRAAPRSESWASLYNQLTCEHPGQASYVMLNSYGGEINRRRWDETASTQRDSISKSSWFTAWLDPAQDDLQLGWLRDTYAAFYADSGGVPARGDIHDGCYVNYPDPDLADTRYNTSGQPWHELFYGDNYERLLRAKRTWDPLDVFHHRMSIDS